MIETRDKPKFIGPRVPLARDEPATLPEVYLCVARDHAKLNTLNYKHGAVWHSISAAEMVQRAQDVAVGLYSLGVRKGDRVAILSESCVEWVLTDQGCLFAGASTVPIYPTLTPPQVEYILKDCAPRVLFVSSRDKLSEVERAVRNCESIAHVVLFESENDSKPGQLTLAELEQQGAELAIVQPKLSTELTLALQPEDLATIIYTSGTTGEPKGVMLTHANMVSNLIDSSNHLEFGDQDTALSVLPLSHIFERQAMNMYLHHGMSVYFGSLENLGESLREVQPTVFVGVPRIYEKIIARVQDRAAEKGKLNARIVAWAIGNGKRWAGLVPQRSALPFWLSIKHRVADVIVLEKLRKAMGGRIRILVSGGAPLSSDVALAFIGARLPIVQG